MEANRRLERVKEEKEKINDVYGSKIEEVQSEMEEMKEIVREKLSASEEIIAEREAVEEDSNWIREEMEEQFCLKKEGLKLIKSLHWERAR